MSRPPSTMLIVMKKEEEIKILFLTRFLHKHERISLKITDNKRTVE